MPRGDDDDGGGDGEARWLTTYGDAMTLLLVFFVLLLSMSTLDPQTFQIVISSFQGAVGVFEGGRTVTPAKLMDMGVNVHKLSEAQSTVSENVPKEVENVLQTEEEQAKVRQDERGLVIQITNQLLFDEGQIDVTERGIEFLERVSLLLKSPSIRDRQLRIEGHTDDVPTESYSSNWQISVLRASNVVEQLIQNGNINPPRLSAVGFGSTRPVASNQTEDGRAKNRRVEIVILREESQPDE